MRERKDSLIILLITAVVIILCLPLFKNIHNINLDWDLLKSLSGARFTRQSILQYHQFPLRAPYFGAGHPAFAHPQSRFFIPFGLFLLIFDEVVYVKLILLFGFLIGALGMYYLARYILRYNRLGAIFASLTFILSGCFYKVIMFRGNPFLAHYFFLPILLACFIKSKQDRKHLFFTAVILTFLLQAGLKFAAILLFLFLFACLQFKRVYFKNFLIIVLLTSFLSAVKIIPMLELLQQSRYSVNFYQLFGHTLLSGEALLERVYGIYRLLLTHQGYSLDISAKGYFPLKFYLGYIPLSLFVLACLFFGKKQLKWLILLAVFSLLSFGTNTPLDLFRLLHRLPVFNALYKPAKYFIPIVTFIIALGAGRSFLLLERFKKRKLIGLIFLALLIIAVTDLYRANRPDRDIYPLTVPQYKVQESFFQVKNTRPNEKVSARANIPAHHAWELTFPTQYELLLQNIGKINAYTNIHLQQAVSPKYYIEWNGKESLEPENYTWQPNPDYKGELYFLNHPQNQAEFAYFSPNKITARVKLVEADTLLINQNYDKYWRSDRGKPHNHQGLLALQLNKKGDYPVTFTYVPVSFYAGAAVSLITLVLLIGYSLKCKRDESTI